MSLLEAIPVVRDWFRPPPRCACDAVDFGDCYCAEDFADAHPELMAEYDAIMSHSNWEHPICHCGLLRDSHGDTCRPAYR